MLLLGISTTSVDQFSHQVSVALAAQRARALTKPVGLTMGDLTGDGLDEVVVASAGENVYEYGGITVVRSTGAGVLLPPIHTNLGIGTREVRIAELTGDAHADVAYIGIASAVTILPGNGTGALGSGGSWSMAGMRREHSACLPATDCR